MERSILSGSPRLRPDPRKHLLAKRGKSQRAIARELGISRITVARVLEEPIDRHSAILTRSAQVDHIVPGSRQGSWTDPTNLATACAPCNSGKGDLLLEEVGWTILPCSDSKDWDGLTSHYRALWEKAERPDPLFHGRMLAELGRAPAG